MNLSNWNKDLPKGEKGELEVVFTLNGILGFEAFEKVEGNELTYDLKSIIEVKLQDKSEEYGTFCIEVADCRLNKEDRRPSGLATSEANYWSIIDETHIYFIPKHLLEAYWEREGERYFEEPMTWGFTIKKDELKNNPEVKIFERLCPKEN